MNVSENTKLVFFIILLMFIFTMLIFRLSKENAADFKAHTEYIGKPIVIDKDTLIIVDWCSGSMFEKRGFTLSNGVFVNESIVINENN